MVVLPDGEEILDVICGDKDFWVISAVQNIAHVKPAKAGAETNLNLVTARGTIYSFLLTEKSGSPTPDLKVYVNADRTVSRRPKKYYSAAEVERIQAETDGGARRRSERAEQRAAETIALERQQYPTRLQFVYGTPKVREAVPRASDLARRAVHVPQGRRDRIAGALRAQGRQAGGRELPGAGHGTYVVPKVLDRGYLALGDARFTFEQRER